MSLQDVERAIRLQSRQNSSKLSLLHGHEPWRQVSTPAFEQLKNPDLSVVITLFNYAHHIEECLDSVLAALETPGHPSTEVLVVDDESLDLSRLTVSRYLERHPTYPLGMFCKTFNTGLSDARNTGVRVSRAPLIFMLDADNTIFPHCLIRLQQAMQDLDVAACYPIIRKFDDLSGESLGLLSQYDWSLKDLVREPYIDAMAMFRRSALLELGGYSLDYVHGWEDYDLWLRIGLGGYTVSHIPEILCNYRVHEQSMLHQTNLRTLNIASSMRKRYVGLASLCDPNDKQFGFFVTDYEALQKPSSPDVANSNPTSTEVGLLQLLRIAGAKLDRFIAAFLLNLYRRFKG